MRSYNEYYLDEYRFEDDRFLTQAERSKAENRGGSGIIRLTKNSSGIGLANEISFSGSTFQTTDDVGAALCGGPHGFRLISRLISRAGTEARPYNLFTASRTRLTAHASGIGSEQLDGWHRQ